MWKDFKAFAMKGNVIDLAVGVIVGTAFSKIVSSLVGDLIMPLFTHYIIGLDFSKLHYGDINYGTFIQSILDFFIIAFSIFMVIRILSRFKKKEEVIQEEQAPDKTEVLLTEIRDLLKKETAGEKWFIPLGWIILGTFKCSIGRIFQSDRGSPSSDFLLFQLAETSSLISHLMKRC